MHRKFTANCILIWITGIFAGWILSACFPFIPVLYPEACSLFGYLFSVLIPLGLLLIAFRFKKYKFIYGLILLKSSIHFYSAVCLIEYLCQFGFFPYLIMLLPQWSGCVLMLFSCAALNSFSENSVRRLSFSIFISAFIICLFTYYFL